jgi:hypothetical protein
MLPWGEALVNDVPDHHYIHDEMETDKEPISGDWAVSQRFCMKARAPLPCTVLALVATLNVGGAIREAA